MPQHIDNTHDTNQNQALSRNCCIAKANEQLSLVVNILQLLQISLTDEHQRLLAVQSSELPLNFAIEAINQAQDEINRLADR